MTVTNSETRPGVSNPQGDRKRDSGVVLRWVGLGMNRFSGLWILGLLIVLFGFWIPDTFLQMSTLQSIVADQSITAMLAFGLILSVAAGAFDLSIAATMGMSSVLVMWGQAHGYNPILSAAAAVLCATLVGIINGVVVVKLGLDSFIATLGMSSILAAVTYWITGGAQILEGISPKFIEFGTNTWLGFPLPVYYMLAVGVIVGVFLDFRPAGRMLYAVGGNPIAARLAGVRVESMLFRTLVSSATIAGFAGVVLAAKLGTGNPQSGPPYLLPVFTAVFLGATQVTRSGRANVPGTLIAILLLATGVKGLQLAGAPAYVNDLFNGVALIVALALALRRRRTA